MKKALALVMAIAMVASMAAVSFAATQINPGLNETVAANKYYGQLQTYTKGVGFGDIANDDKVVFGTTVYSKLLTAGGAAVTNADAVKGLNVTATWEKNGEYVKSVEIVKAGTVYAIAISTQGSSLEDVNVLGEVQVKGKSYYEVVESGKLVGKKADVKFKFEVSLDLAYLPGTADNTITLNNKDKKVFNFENFTPAAADGEILVKFGDLDVEVSPKGVKKVLLAYNETVNEELYDQYLDADLLFYNCTGAFRRTATVTVDVPENYFFYEVVDGALVAVDGEYDEWTEELTFKTRTMGSYVLSDTELVVEEVAVANPSTGAAA